MLRPADANEVSEAYRYIMQLRHQPAAVALSRQPLPTSCCITSACRRPRSPPSAISPTTC